MMGCMVLTIRLATGLVMSTLDVVKGAGGLITDWMGKELDINSDGSVLAAGDAAIHRAASAVLNGVDVSEPVTHHRVG